MNEIEIQHILNAEDARWLKGSGYRINAKQGRLHVQDLLEGAYGELRTSRNSEGVSIILKTDQASYRKNGMPVYCWYRFLPDIAEWLERLSEGVSPPSASLVTALLSTGDPHPYSTESRIPTVQEIASAYRWREDIENIGVDDDFQLLLKVATVVAHAGGNMRHRELMKALMERGESESTSTQLIKLACRHNQLRYQGAPFYLYRLAERPSDRTCS